MNPVHGLAVRLRILIHHRNDVVQYRSLGSLRQGLKELEVAGNRFRGRSDGIAGLGLGDLDEALVAFAEHVGQRQDILIGHAVGGHRSAVIVRLQGVLAEPLDGEAAGASVHRLVQQPLHLAAFRGGGRARLRRLHAHDVGQQRRDRHIAHAIDALGNAGQVVKPLRKRLPIPRHARLHGGERNLLGARHHQERTVAVRRLHGREAETAVAEHHGGDAVPARNGAIGVPVNLRVVVGVQVHEPGRHDEARGVEFPGSRSRGNSPDFHHFASPDAHIGAQPRQAGAVNDGSASDD